MPFVFLYVVNNQQVKSYIHRIQYSIIKQAIYLTSNKLGKNSM